MKNFNEVLRTTFQSGEEIRDKRIVFKVGSSTITQGQSSVNQEVVDQLAVQTDQLMRDGYEVTIVTSGAVACGRYKLGQEKSTSVSKHVLATVGQRFLEHSWGEAFTRVGRDIGYFAYSERDIQDYRCLKVRLSEALSSGIVPVINANDAVNSFENSQLAISADNDRLAGFVARLVEAGTLVLLTEADGVWDTNKHVISSIKQRSDLERVYVQEKTGLGTGGILSKLEVATCFASHGRRAFIANGREKGILLRVVGGEQVGTQIQMEEEYV